MYRGFRVVPLLFIVLTFALTACPSTNGGGNGGAPQITSFTASPDAITAAGQPVTLNWAVTNGVTSLEIDSGVGSVTGNSVVVNPAATTTYTLSATNSSGTDEETVEVSLGIGPGPTPGPGAEDGLPPTLNTFGVSLTQSGFENDQGSNISDANDPRIVRVQPGGTFYAVVSATDPGGIAGVTVFLANSSPPGLRADLVEGQSVSGFTLNGEVGNCVLDGTETSVTCIYEIAVGNIPNIDDLTGSGDEFAYVFRTRVRDAAGNESDTPPRGYVIVGDGGGTPNPPPDDPPPVPPPGDPPPDDPPPVPPPGDPPANREPTAAFTSEQTVSDTTGVTYKFSAAESGDPDGDELSYDWDFGDGSGSEARDFTKKYTEDGDYTVKLTVDDGNGGTDTETEKLKIDVPGDGTTPPPGDEPVISSFEAEPAEISEDESSVLNWNVTGATSLSILPDVGTVTGTSTEVSPDDTTEYTLTATNSSGSVTATTTVMVSDDDGDDGDETPHTLTVTEPENGTVTSDPGDIDCGSTCSDDYDEGTEITLTANPAEGYEFSSWGGACEGATDTTCTVTMDADETVTATFSAEVTLPTPTYQLAVTGPENGTVTSDPVGIDCGDTCTASYTSGEEVELTASPDEGYKFDSWGGDCSGMTCTITMDFDKAVTATFSEESTTPTVYTLTVTEPENGTVTGQPGDIDCGSTCSDDYDEGAEVTLIANPEDDYELDSWGGDCSSATGATCTITMNANTTVSATFSAEETTPGDSDLKADFEYTSSGTEVQFISNTEGSNGNVLSYSWEFGDGEIGSGPKTTHTYAEAGTYKVFLTARTDDGATSRIDKDVTVTD